MSEMARYRFTDLYEISSGISTTKEQAGHGSPFLSFSTIYNNYFLPDELPDLMATSEAEQRKYSVREGDVFVTRTSETLDELAMSCVSLTDYPQATFSGFAKRLRPKDPTFPDPRYIAFYLRGPYFRKTINSMATMTTRASFNETLFSFLNISLPSKETQQRVGAFLSVIQDKIRINNQVNDNLSAMVHELYMHSFFRKTPNGKLGQIISEQPKSTIQVGEAKASSGNYPFFTSGDAILRWEEPLIDGRICLLNTGGNADVKFYVGKAAYSTDTWCITGKNEFSDYLFSLLLAIKQELIQKFFQGTGLKHLQKPLLRNRPIYIPDTREINHFNSMAIPAFSKISANQRENYQLASLRDWLLPMLMNGQTTIASDSDKLSFI